tara:strand:- start:81 stop:935 length:855 start_codon:yes stop_codon:yes gene_type:complete
MKTRTHTHRGHCQACGRTQAVDVNHNLIAKHGYTVDFGFFNGVCNGSDNAPLQVEKTLTEETIIDLTDWIAETNIKLADLKSGKVTISNYWITLKDQKVKDIDLTKPELRSYKESCELIAYTEEMFKSHFKSYKDNPNRGIYTCSERYLANLHNQYTRLLINQVAQAVDHVANLKTLINQVHGQPLINVADVEKVLNELEQEAMIGFNETAVKVQSTQVSEEYFINKEKEATKKTSIGTIGIKVSRATVWISKSSFYDRSAKISVNCLLNGKRIARDKLIEKLQ